MQVPPRDGRPGHRACKALFLSLLLALLLGASPVSADPPILPLQGPQVAGLLTIPVFALGRDVSQPGSYRLEGPSETTGTSGVALGVFTTPEPFMIVTAGSGNSRYTRGSATLVYEFTIVPPPELGCAFPAFAIPGPECLADVVVLPSGRVQTLGGTILVGDPLPSFAAEATWSLRDDLGVEVFSDGRMIPFSQIGIPNDVFGEPTPLTLKANRAYRVTMRVNAEAAATTLPASTTALVGSGFAFAPAVPAGYSFRFSNGIEHSGTVPEPDSDVLLLAGVVALGLRARRIPRPRV